MIKAILMFAMLLSAMPALASDKLIQLIEYIGADYKEAVHNGEVVNAAEYAEMQEFASLIAAQLPEGSIELQQQAATLQQMVASHAEPVQVQQVTALMRKAVIAAMPDIALPQQAPDLNRGKALYQTNCAVCHGMTAMGDGPGGAQLDPAPTNFHDLERYRARSLFGLFNTISLGVADTGMASFAYLDAQSRWDLAFYVGAIAAEQIDVTVLDTALVNKNVINSLFTATPSDLELAAAAQGSAQMALFRMQPEQFYNATELSPLQLAIDKLVLTQQALQEQRFESAYQHAVSAYIDGFELIENNLQAIEPELKNTIEQRMLKLRQQIKQQQV
ncbi:MAG TPA: cytochrome c, partial [Rheinheimera sp.]|nr:cytochrome c [Rheinheimera sp.]